MHDKLQRPPPLSSETRPDKTLIKLRLRVYKDTKQNGLQGPGTTRTQTKLVYKDLGLQGPNTKTVYKDLDLQGPKTNVVYRTQNKRGLQGPKTKMV